MKSSALQELPLPLTQALAPAPKSSADVEGTVVTPRVGAIAQRLFCQPFHIVEMSEDGRNAAPQNITSWPVHKGDPEVVEWGESVGDSGAFQTVVLDGTTYRVCVSLICFALSNYQ